MSGFLISFAGGMLGAVVTVTVLAAVLVKVGPRLAAETMRRQLQGRTPPRERIGASP